MYKIRQVAEAVDNLRELIVMKQKDLFGYVPPVDTWEVQYRKYINSPAWKKKCKEALKRAGDKCQRCGTHKGHRRIEVHHLTYDNFMNERPEDLEVVCVQCHHMADREREEDVERRRHERLEDARFEGWARKVYGEDWMMHGNEDYIYAEYEAWCERNEIF